MHWGCSAGAGCGCNGCTMCLNDIEKPNAKSCLTSIVVNVDSLEIACVYIDLFVFDFKLHYN